MPTDRSRRTLAFGLRFNDLMPSRESSGRSSGTRPGRGELRVWGIQTRLNDCRTNGRLQKPHARKGHSCRASRRWLRLPAGQFGRILANWETHWQRSGGDGELDRMVRTACEWFRTTSRLPELAAQGDTDRGLGMTRLSTQTSTQSELHRSSRFAAGGQHSNRCALHELHGEITCRFVTALTTQRRNPEHWANSIANSHQASRIRTRQVTTSLGQRGH